MVIESRALFVIVGITFITPGLMQDQDDVETTQVVQEVWSDAVQSITIGASHRNTNLAIIGSVWPKEFTEKMMAELMDDEDPAVRLVACECLMRTDLDKHRNRIAATVDELSAFRDPSLDCRLNVLRFKLGLPNGSVALKAFVNLAHVRSRWLCPMDSEVIGESGDVCHICGMSLVDHTAEATELDIEAQFCALEELIRKGEHISSGVFRELIAGQLDARWRRRAACIWNFADSEQATPHVTLSLKLQHSDTLTYVATHFPNQFAVELAVIAKDESASSENRTLAAFGLIKAGNHEYANLLRHVAFDEQADPVARSIAIEGIGEFGNAGDIDQLLNVIEGDMRFFIAPAVFKLLKKSRPR